MVTAVTIILVNWNGATDTLECFKSLLNVLYARFNIIIVDNASTDNSVCEFTNTFLSYFNESYEIIFKNYHATMYTKPQPSQKNNVTNLVLIKCNANLGFAKGNNLGILFTKRYFGSEYVLLLNNDTVVDPFFLDALITAVQNNEKIGIAGPKIYYYDNDGRKDIINFAGGAFNVWLGEARHIGCNQIDNAQFEHMQQTDYVNGACFLIRHDVIDRIGLLSEDYFLYWEEVDFCLRASKYGYISAYVPSAKIWHKTGSSIAKINYRSHYYMTRGRFILMFKNASMYQIFIFLTYFFTLKAWISIFFYLKSGSFDSIKCFIKGIVDGLNFSSHSKLTHRHNK